jgi:hypothetical protein
MYNKSEIFKKKFFDISKSVNIIRIRDKKGVFLPRTYAFLEHFMGSDMLSFRSEKFNIIFIKEREKIINIIVSDQHKEYVQDEILFTDFKKIILNDNFGEFSNIFTFSKKRLFCYELDLINDINDWLNGTLSEKKIYNLVSYYI